MINKREELIVEIFKNISPELQRSLSYFYILYCFFKEMKDSNNINKKNDLTTEKVIIKNQDQKFFKTIKKENTYKDKLKKYANNYEQLKIILSANEIHSEIIGIIIEVSKDYITILDLKYDKIEIPINKIHYLKKIKKQFKTIKNEHHTNNKRPLQKDNINVPDLIFRNSGILKDNIAAISHQILK